LVKKKPDFSGFYIRLVYKQLFGNNLLSLRGIARILILLFRYYAGNWIQLLQATADDHTLTYLFWGCWDMEPCVWGTWISLQHWQQVKRHHCAPSQGKQHISATRVRRDRKGKVL